ncbi:hypothetical protein SNEBB_006850 [Seison nebaliae]|nr:hypothetical protein SNEBB_006850 [Seison nebaliae]
MACMYKESHLGNSMKNLIDDFDSLGISSTPQLQRQDSALSFSDRNEFFCNGFPCPPLETNEGFSKRNLNKPLTDSFNRCMSYDADTYATAAQPLMKVSKQQTQISSSDYSSDSSKSPDNIRSPNITTEVQVPTSEHVAEIVGRHGCKIKALRSRTNTYIKTPGRGERSIFTITGRPENVNQAKVQINAAAAHFTRLRQARRRSIDCTSESKDTKSPPPPMSMELPEGHVTKSVRVPIQLVGLVVGPKGNTIKQIQAATQTYIVTPGRDAEPVFEVTGVPEDVDSARLCIIMHILERTQEEDYEGTDFLEEATKDYGNRREEMIKKAKNILLNTQKNPKSLSMANFYNGCLDLFTSDGDNKLSNNNVENKNGSTSSSSSTSLFTGKLTKKNNNNNNNNNNGRINPKFLNQPILRHRTWCLYDHEPNDMEHNNILENLTNNNNNNNNINDEVFFQNNEKMCNQTSDERLHHRLRSHLGQTSYSLCTATTASPALPRMPNSIEYDNSPPFISSADYFMSYGRSVAPTNNIINNNINYSDEYFKKNNRSTSTTIASCPSNSSTSCSSKISLDRHNTFSGRQYLQSELQSNIRDHQQPPKMNHARYHNNLEHHHFHPEQNYPFNFHDSDEARFNRLKFGPYRQTMNSEAKKSDIYKLSSLYSSNGSTGSRLSQYICNDESPSPQLEEWLDNLEADSSSPPIQSATPQYPFERNGLELINNLIDN